MLPTKLFAGRSSQTLLASCSFLLLASAAGAAPITGGMTTVALDSSTLTTLQSLFTIGTVPPTQLTTSSSGASVNFPIVGGDTSTGMIDHSGGLTLTGKATPTGVGTEVTTENYVINLNTLQLTAEVMAAGTTTMAVPLFNIGAGDVLTVNSALAGDLSAIYGVPNLMGSAIGTATVSPTTGTPEPSSFALAAAGLLAAVFACRRRRSKVISAP